MIDYNVLLTETGAVGVAIAGFFVISKFFVKTINERDEVHRLFLQDIMTEDRAMREEDRQSRAEDRHARAADRQEHSASYSKLSDALDKLTQELKR